MPSTRVALVTPPGRGGIALLEVAGDERILASVFSKPLPGEGALALGELGTGDGPIDEVLVARVAGDRFEVGCHGGPAVARRAIAALVAKGAVAAEATALPRRGIEREARRLLPLAETELAAKVLLAGLSGQLERSIAALPVTKEALSALEASARLGLACWKAPRVALAGRPNAGKSTLFNALLGKERAIVSPEAGTTRDAIEESCSLGGLAVKLTDLAGDRESEDPVEQAGVARGRERARSADLRLLVADASAPWEPPSFEGKALLVLAKRDLLTTEGRAHLRHRIARTLPDGTSVLEVSAVTGSGMEALRAAIVRELVGTTEIARPVLFTERQRDHARRALEALEAGREGDARRQLLEISEGEPWPDGSC
jgi:tRNA modification GTPase